MKNIYLIIFSLSLMVLSPAVLAQDDEEKTPLEISGSVDTYFTYDFSGMDNIPTSFADDRNSVSIGMVDIALSQTVGKASFVGEISFGPRSFKSIPLFDTGGDAINVGIQNLYVSYALSDVVSLTAGYMGTFVGYEVISPAGNFNYSTSYLFTNGPFQNSGLKADFAISDKFAFMVGIFNDWNVYSDDNGVSDFGAQLYFAPVDGWDIYVNFLTGSPSGTIIDLTTGFQISDAFYLGLNAADYSVSDGDGGYTGFALYPQVALNDWFSLGLRGEYFKIKDIGGTENPNIFATTITANMKAGGFTFIPELRFDSVSEDLFSDKDGAATAAASQVTLAAVYAF